MKKIFLILICSLCISTPVLAQQFSPEQRQQNPNLFNVTVSQGANGGFVVIIPGKPKPYIFATKQAVNTWLDEYVATETVNFRTRINQKLGK